MENWIPVSKSMPPIGDRVLVALEGETILKGTLFNNGWMAFFADGEKHVGGREVTHWMPMPAGPYEINSAGKSELSIRELIAATINVYADVENYSVDFFKNIMGKEVPLNDPIGNYKYWAEAEAKLRVIKADALIAELSNPQP